MSPIDHASRTSAHVFSAAAIALLLTSCGASDDDSPKTSQPEGAQSSGAASEPEGDQAAANAGTEFNGSPLGQMNAYVFERINAAEPTEASDWEDQLDDAFTSMVSAADLSEVINGQIQPGAPWELEAFTPVDEHASVSIITSETGRVSMELSLDPDTELINGINFSPLPEVGEAASSFDEIEARLDELPVETTMLVIEDGETLYEREADRVMPLSSTAKLYVLYALTQAIEAGEAAWEDTLTLTDELRSLPSGQLQNEEPGYEISVADAAALMISISDNTATDMIIDHLGRETVAEAVNDAEHHDPALMTPYLMTGDLFQLRWAEPELGEQYLAADEAGRAEILESLEGEVLELDPAEMTQDADDEQELEWYGTAEDVLAVHQALGQMREVHPELTEILTANPGLVTEPEDPWWEEIAYKGGSAFEALSGSWALRDAEDRQRTVVVLIHGEDPVEVQALLGPVFGMAQDAFSLEE